MKAGPQGSFGAQLKGLRESAGYTQEELATIAGLSVHAVSALERGERRRPHVETLRALSAALDLSGAIRDALIESARAPMQSAAVDELSDTTLPVILTALLGRDADMETLRRWLTDPTARLITLTGPGGAGKTRLAIELARAIAEEGATRVVFVPLAAIRNPAFVAPAIAEALGLADVTSTDLPRRARVACCDRPTLLVLDNFEQVLDAAPLAADLLASVVSLRVLATSRAPLRVRGEREYSVGPLSLEADSKAASPAAPAHSPAVRLFLERVRDVEPHFRLTPANGRTVAAICQRLDALPLALELAAPWLKVLSPDDLLDRLARDVLLSTVGRRDFPERHQTINATVAWSYQLLAPHEQRVFRRLGALPGRFPIEAAASVLAGADASSTPSDADALRAVAGLIDKSLLLRAETSVPARPLYEMLETVRAFAALELNAARERDDAMEGLARYCHGQAALAAVGLVGPAQVEWLNRVRDDLESYRSALAWLLERARPAGAAHIASGLMQYWQIRGRSAEGLQWYEQILNFSSLPPALEAKALVDAAMMSYSLGDLERARTRLTRALALAHDVEDEDTVVRAEHLFGHVEHGVGNTGAARDRFTRSIEGFRALGIPWGLGNSLNGMAKVALATGDDAEAERLLGEATSVLQRCPWFLALALYRRALLAVRRGNTDEAIALVRECLLLFRPLHDKFAIVYVTIPLAAAAVLKGDDAWAARILGARDAVTERTGASIADKWVRDMGERAEREARARLGPDRWARAYAAGRVTSMDAWIKGIDDVLRTAKARPERRRGPLRRRLGQDARTGPP